MLETPYSENTLDDCFYSHIQAVVSVIHEIYNGIVICIAVLLGYMCVITWMTRFCRSF
jgi:hypothetical protein